MQTNKKLPSYTLSEIIVVLILTSIIVGLAFAVLRLVQGHIRDIQTNFEQVTEIHKLEQSLWLDFNRYREASYDPIENKLILSSEMDSTFYIFSKKYIASEIDTFTIQLKKVNFYFLGNPVQKGKIDATKLTTTKAFQNRMIFVYMKSDAATYMK